MAEFEIKGRESFLKTSVLSASRSDRIAKYNQLLRIKEELGANAKFIGKTLNTLKNNKH